MTVQRRGLLGVAVAFVLASPARGAQLQPRWQPADPAPDVEGVHLGDTRAQVVQALGEPEPSPLPDDPAAAIHTLRYRDGALLVAIDQTGHVARILLTKREGGALAGIRVGDHLGALLTSWGEPTSSTSKVGRYEMDTWTISVKADLGAQIVLRLMLAATPARPAQ